MSKIIQFYLEEEGNLNGYFLSEIMCWSDGALEIDHDWIQIVFPSNEPSGFNYDAPVLTKEDSEQFINNPELKNKLKNSFVRFLKFLEFEMIEEDGQIKFKTLNSNPLWLREFNHNMLRVTRVLKSLRLNGLGDYALALYNFLKANFRSKVSANTWDFWTKAIFNPLW